METREVELSLLEQYLLGVGLVSKLPHTDEIINRWIGEPEKFLRMTGGRMFFMLESAKLGDDGVWEVGYYIYYHHSVAFYRHRVCCRLIERRLAS